MSPPIASIRLVGPAGDAATAAVAAAQHVFPSALVTRTDELKELLGVELAPGTEVLVLLAPRQADLDRAVTAVDTRGHPRWALVACSASPAPANSHLLTVTPDNWNEPMLEVALTTAVRLQAFQSAQIQLQGDLRTISRRLGHDMRSPLNCIVTTNEAMADPDADPKSPQAVYSQTIADSVDDVVQLFERLSFVMKATTNPPVRQPVIMEEIVWGSLQRLESRMRKAGAKVSKPAQWPVLEGVPAWVDVIWSNLLINSMVHAGPEPHIELGWEALPGEYRFWLRDQGTGVPAKQRDQLFHPLDRMSELNAPRGLGLPIVHRLVELSGGRCGHEPAATGSGTFYFILPAIAPAAAT